MNKILNNSNTITTTTTTTTTTNHVPSSQSLSINKIKKLLILPNTIISIIIEKSSIDDPTLSNLIKLVLVCKKWASQIVPYHFCHLKHYNFEKILQLATNPLIENGRECKFTDIQLTRQQPTTTTTSTTTTTNLSTSTPSTPRYNSIQITNGKLQQFLMQCNTIQSISIVNYCLDYENNFGVRISEILSNSLGQYPSISKLELMNLDLVSNGSSNIISNLKTNNSLTHLNLSRNYLREKDGILIGDAISVNSTLKKLDLSFNEFKISGLKAIIEGLQKNNSITHINLEAVCRLDCMITGVSLSSPPLTPNNNNTNNTNTLSSSNNNFNIIGSPINTYLQLNNNNLSLSNGFNLNLLSLNSSNNNIGNGGNNNTHFNPLLLGTPPSTNHSWMIGSSGNDFHFSSANWIPSSPSSISINSKMIDAIRNLGDNKTLRSINLSHNTFGKPFNMSLFELVYYTNSLTTLHLNYLKLDDESGEKITGALKLNTSLITISLIYNQLGKETACSLSNSLQFNNTLEHLYLSNNLFNGDDGTDIMFGDMLLKNQSLKTLDISDNNLCYQGIKLIMESLKINKKASLSKLSIRNNNISDLSGSSIGSMLSSNKKLQYLDISFNNLYCNSIISISSSLEQNTSLLVLNISFNNCLEPNFNSDQSIKKCISSIGSLLNINKTLQSFEIEGNQFKFDQINDFSKLLIKNQNHFFNFKSFNPSNTTSPSNTTTTTTTTTLSPLNNLVLKKKKKILDGILNKKK